MIPSSNIKNPHKKYVDFFLFTNIFTYLCTMIDLKSLTDKDVTRKVVYQSMPHSKLEEGRITSFNDKFVFVDYDNTGRGQATPPEKLDFVTK